MILNGFGNRPAAENAFDSTIGLLGMVAILRGLLPSQATLPEKELLIEGWILGQAV